jgi:TonB family protein
MPILDLPPNPLRTSTPPNGQAGAPNDTPATAPTPEPTPASTPSSAAPRLAVRSGRYVGLQEHELIHLLDSIDDEVSRARFRESIYKSIIICIAVTWFLFYGPRVLFHQPELRDPIALMKQHDKEQVTYLNPPNLPAPKPPPHPVLDRKTMQQIQQQARMTPPAPQPPAPQTPQEEARNTAPPIPQPQLPLPPAPKPAPALADSPLPAAPKPSFAQNSSPGDAIQNAARNAMGARGQYGNAPSASTAPLQAGAEILSDTMGVDFSAYMRRLHADVQRNWDPLIPEEVQPPLLKRGIVGIRFTILPGGQIGNMVLETRSGDVALDHAAWNAITSEGQFPPLPKEFHGPQLELRCGFYYNTPLQQ